MLNDTEATWLAFLDRAIAYYAGAHVSVQDVIDAAKAFQHATYVSAA